MWTFTGTPYANGTGCPALGSEPQLASSENVAIVQARSELLVSFRDHVYAASIDPENPAAFSFELLAGYFPAQGSGMRDGDDVTFTAPLTETCGTLLCCERGLTGVMQRQSSAMPSIVPPVPPDLASVPLAIVGGRLIVGTTAFSFYGSPSRHTLWSVDGERAALLIDDATFGPPMVGSTGKAFVAVFRGANHAELWRTDGTPEGTARVHMTTPAPVMLSLFGFVGETLLFGVQDDWNAPMHLWRTDGSDAGTTIVGDLSNPVFVGTVDGALLLAVGRHIWRSDGTTEGTVALAAIDGPAGVLAFGHVGRWALFAVGPQLFRSDGTIEGTGLVRDFGASASLAASMDTDLSARHPNKFLFEVDSPGGTGLWRTDGTTEGTRRLTMVPPTVISPTFEIATLRGTTFFAAADGKHGDELWRRDRTSRGASLVRDIHAGPADSSPSDFVRAGRHILFSADSGHGRTLWRADTSRSGRPHLRQIRADLTVGFPNEPPVMGLGGTAFFAANDGVHGVEVWRSDGTARRTVMVGDLYPCGNETFPPAIQQRLSHISSLVARDRRPPDVAAAQREQALIASDAADAFAQGELSAACAGEAIAIARRLVGND
jgi:ELWxxDGT repeat protein